MTIPRLLMLSALVALIATAGVASAAAASPVQAKQQAELNILRTPRYFWRAGLHGFIRSRTKTFRTNVTVTCGGARGAAKQAHVFLCLLRYRGKTATVRYTALGKYAFRLRIVHRSTG